VLSEEGAVYEIDHASGKDDAKNKLCSAADPFFFRGGADCKDKKEDKDGVFNQVGFSMVDKSPEHLDPGMALESVIQEFEDRSV
jgi:hypothetical protein